jgi:hypothetical protein
LGCAHARFSSASCFSSVATRERNRVHVSASVLMFSAMLSTCSFRANFSRRTLPSADDHLCVLLLHRDLQRRTTSLIGCHQRRRCAASSKSSR